MKKNRIRCLGIILSTLIVGIVPLSSEEVFASSQNQTPSLNAYQMDDHVKLEWAVEMLDEDVLYKTSFENGDEIPFLNYGGVDKAGGTSGGQSITSEQVYEGSKSLKIHDTYTNGQRTGNPDINGNYQYANFSRAIFDRKYVANGTNLSISFRAKTTGEAIISPSSQWEQADYGSPMNITFLEKVNAGSTTAKVSDPSFFKEYLDRGERFYLADRKGKYTRIYVTSVNLTQKTITVNSPFQSTFEKGEPVLAHTIRQPVSFQSRHITNRNWELFNVNTKVANHADYNTLVNGFSFTIFTETRDTVYIDSLKMGYATRTQLYRGSQIIYDGYLSDFEDTEATDKTPPPKVSNFTTSKEGEKTFIQASVPDDNGTNYSYKVKAISNSGGTSYMSDTKTINIKSGFKGFSYVIDDKPNTIPSGTVNSTTGKIEVPINANGDWYLHIRAIDKAGNASETTHLPLNGIAIKKLEVTVPNIQPFPTIVLQDQPKAYKTSFTSSFNIKNYYPETGKGWRLDVSASQLRLVGDQYTLPKGTIRLEPLSSIERVGEGLGSLPTKGITQKTVIDNGKVTVANATSGNGIGEYKLTFPQNALEIVIDPTTAKRGRYQSTITWELVQAP